MEAAVDLAHPHFSSARDDAGTPAGRPHPDPEPMWARISPTPRGPKTADVRDIQAVRRRAGHPGTATDRAHRAGASAGRRERRRQVHSSSRSSPGAEPPHRHPRRSRARPVSISTTNEAMALGIATVYQEPQLFAELTVSENIFTGREIRKGGRMTGPHRTRRSSNCWRCSVCPRATPPTILRRRCRLPSSNRCRSPRRLAGNAKILILDEPSAILTDPRSMCCWG